MRDAVEDGHRPAWTLPQRNDVAHGEVLKLRKNARGTGAIQKAEKPVEPVVAIQPAARYPICTSHGQICSGGASTVMAIVPEYV